MNLSPSMDEMDDGSSTVMRKSAVGGSGVVRLHIHAANLPLPPRRGILAGRRNASCFAVVTSLSLPSTPCSSPDAAGQQSMSGSVFSASTSMSPLTMGSPSTTTPATPTQRNVSGFVVDTGNIHRQHGKIWGRTEVVKFGSHPLFTNPITLEYNPDEDFHFFVHIVTVDGNDKQKNNRRASTRKSDTAGDPPNDDEKDDDDTADSASSDGTGFSNHSLNFDNAIGAAMFEVRDILSTRNSTRAKRLRAGGCIFCHVEPVVAVGDGLVAASITGEPTLSSSAPRDARVRSDLRLVLQVSIHDLQLPGGGGRIFARKQKVANSRDELVLQILTKRRLGDSPELVPSEYANWFAVHRCHPSPTENEADVLQFYCDMDMDALCHDDDLDRPLRFQVLHASAESKLICLAETTLRHITRLALEDGTAPPDATGRRPNELFLQRSLSKPKQVGRLRVHSCRQVRAVDAADAIAPAVREANIDDQEEIEVQPSVVEVVDLAALNPIAPPAAVAATNGHQTATIQDYMPNGKCELEFHVAIDFTSSNGNPYNPGTYHYQSSQYLNDYEETILAVGKAIDKYSYSHEHRVCGFGAKFGGVVRHYFQCGKDAVVKGVDGILAAYRKVFETDLIMSGPTILLQVMQAAAVQANKDHQLMQTSRNDDAPLKYHVLLIITDGRADEFEETVRKLAVYSQQPLSVVIVGVGREAANVDFSRMHKLVEMQRQHPEAVRANLTFVEFRHHQYDPAALGVAALQQVPDQLVEYMRQHGY